MKEQSNLITISVEEFIERVNSKNYRVKGYYSLYITPKGEIIDCRYPSDLGHNNLSIEVYSHLDELPEQTFNSCLRGLNIPFSDVGYYVMDYYNLQNVMYYNAELYTYIDKVLLGSEDIICQDMGFVKLAINTKLKYFEVVVPNTIFQKRVTGAQKDCVDKLSTYFNLDIDEKLKSNQTENSKKAVEIKAILDALKKTV